MLFNPQLFVLVTSVKSLLFCNTKRMEFDGVLQSMLKIHQAGIRKLIIFYLELLKGHLKDEKVKVESKMQFFFR
jgi:hypothetical protein